MLIFWLAVAFFFLVPLLLSLLYFNMMTWHNLIIMKGTNWTSIGESFFALVYVVVIAPLLWAKSMILSVLVVGKTERLKLHRSHGGLFWAPKESGRGQAAGSSDYFVLEQENPCGPSTSAALNFLLLQHFVVLTKRGEKECCVPHHQVSVTALPYYSKVCFVCACVCLENQPDGWLTSFWQTAVNRACVSKFVQT